MNAKLIGIVFALALPFAATAGSGEHKSHYEQYQIREMERLNKELSLTDDQKSKLETLFKQEREKLKTVREEARSQMQTILTSEQYSKLQDLKQERREKWQQKHQEREQEKSSASQH